MAQTASVSERPHGSGLGRDGARRKADSNSNSLSVALAADDDLDAPQIAGRGRTIDALRAFNLCSDGAVEDKVSDKVFVTSPEVSQPRSVSTCSAGSLPDPDSETVTTSVVMSKTSEGEPGRTADTAMSLADFGRGISDLGFYAEMNRLNSGDISRLGSSESFARMLSTMGAEALVGIPSRTPSITRRITAPAAYGASFLEANLLVASADNNIPPPTERVLVTDDAEQPAAQVASPKAVRRTQSAGNAPMLPPPMVPRRSGPVLPVFPQAGLAVTGPAAAAVASPSLAPKPVPPIASGAAAGGGVEPAVSAALEVALRGGRQGWVAAAAPAAPGTTFMVSTKATVTASASAPAAAVSVAAPAKPAKRGRRQGKKRKSVSPTPMDDGDIDTNCSPAELKRRRRELRLKRNRESAFRSRLRRKAQNQQMSSELKRLRIATDDQRKDINALRSHAEALAGMVERLQQALRARGASEEEVGAGAPQMPGAIWVAPPPGTAGRGGGSAGEGEDDVSMAGDGSSGSAGEDRVARATAGRIGLAMMAVVFTFSITLFGVTDIMHHATAHAAGGAVAAGEGMQKGRVLHHLQQPQLLAHGQPHAALEVGSDFSNTPALLSPAALLTHVLTAAGVPHLAEMVIAAVALLAIGGSISLFLLGRWTAGVVFTNPSYYSTNGSELPTAFDARCMVDEHGVEASTVHSDAGSDDNDEDEPVQRRAARAKVPSYDKSTMKAAMATQKNWYAPINAALGAAPPLHRAASVSDIPSCFRDPASEVRGKAGKGKSKGKAAGRGRAGTE